MALKSGAKCICRTVIERVNYTQGRKIRIHNIDCPVHTQEALEKEVNFMRTWIGKGTPLPYEKPSWMP